MIAIYENSVEEGSTAHATSVAPRTTASNNLAMTKTTMLKKTHRNSNVESSKLGAARDTPSVFAPLSLSDEDDSLEREVVLKSPEKGKDFQRSSKVCQ
jgi:hypothetical protein